MVINTKSKVTLCMACAVCGEAVPITESEARYTTFKLCPECIKAIKFARRLMKNNPNMNVEDDGK